MSFVTSLVTTGAPVYQAKEDARKLRNDVNAEISAMRAAEAKAKNDAALATNAERARRRTIRSAMSLGGGSATSGIAESAMSYGKTQMGQ